MNVCVFFWICYVLLFEIDINYAFRLLENLNKIKKERERESVIMNLKLLFKLKERERKQH